MVDKKEIQNVLESVLFGVVKCKPLKEVKGDLSKMSQDEKNASLEGLLNPAEKEWYDGIIHRLEGAKRNVEYYSEKIKGDYRYESDREYYKEQLKGAKKRIDFLKDLAFPYERRIIEGYNKEQGKIPDVDQSKFHEEEQFQFMYENKVNRMEQVQIQQQEKMDLDKDTVDSLRYYFNEGASPINSMLNNGKRYQRLTGKELEETTSKNNSAINKISKAIQDSQGLIEDTVLFHGGEFDVSKIAGDKIKFKGYTSTSFQENVAKEFHNYSSVPSELYYTYRILAPKGTKGICANDESHGVMGSHPREQEYLLDKGSEATILDVDVENHIVTIVLD